MNNNYSKLVNEVFQDHHDCMGLSNEEIQELMETSSLDTREQWLKKVGYDLKNMYESE